MPVALGYDVWAQKYEEAGISVSCENFISMKKVMPLIQEPLSIEPGSQFVEIDVAQISKQSNEFIENGDYKKLNQFIKMELAKLVSQNYNCMTRHIFESAYLISFRAPLLIQMAKDKKLSSPATGLNFLLKQHLSSLVLWGAQFTDQLAIESQRQGVPILCYDVPDILAESQMLKNSASGN